MRVHNILIGGFLSLTVILTSPFGEVTEDFIERWEANNVLTCQSQVPPLCDFMIQPGKDLTRFYVARDYSQFTDH